jgi:protein-S-isoprenylcysteine O-methyltransferase Ste14
VNAPVRKVLPPVWLALCVVTGYALHKLMPVTQLFVEPWKYGGAGLIVLGVVVSATAANLFKRADTPVIPFRPSTALVTTGWYRFTRNPMYLGMVLVACGVAIVQGSLGAWIPVPLFVAILQLRFIRGEEKFLEEIFGEDYLRFKSRVRRWL